MSGEKYLEAQMLQARNANSSAISRKARLARVFHFRAADLLQKLNTAGSVIAPHDSQQETCCNNGLLISYNKSIRLELVERLASSS